MMAPDLRTIVLTPTCRKYEPFCEALSATLSSIWSDHPQHWIITDGDLSGPQVVTCQGNWIVMLKEGLRLIEERSGPVDRVVLVLEDLLPLWSVDADYQNALLTVAVESDLAQIVVPTYRPKWHGEGEEQFATFKGHRFTTGPVDIGGVRLNEMNPKLRWYSQTQPGIWRRTHLEAMLDQAIEAGHDCAWGFEFCRNGDKHYLAERCWPSVWNGLFEEGKVNPWVMPHLLSARHAELRGLMMEKLMEQAPAMLRHRLGQLPHKFWSAGRLRLKLLRDRMQGRRPGFED